MRVFFFAFFLVALPKIRRLQKKEKKRQNWKLISLNELQYGTTIGFFHSSNLFNLYPKYAFTLWPAMALVFVFVCMFGKERDFTHVLNPRGV